MDEHSVRQMLLFQHDVIRALLDKVEDAVGQADVLALADALRALDHPCEGHVAHEEALLARIGTPADRLLQLTGEHRLHRRELLSVTHATELAAPGVFGRARALSQLMREHMIEEERSLLAG
jgi:hypothetical protein